MSEVFPTYNLTTCEATPSVISLQVLRDGLSLCNSPDGPQIDLFGPALVPASPTAQPESVKATPTSATCGLSSSVSSASAALQQSLENRLRRQLSLDGSIEYSLTWKVKATPAGRQYCLLRASAPRTSGRACSGWPTPQAHDERERGNTMADHHHFPHDLSNAAKMAGWPSPNWHDGRRPAPDLKSTQGTNLSRDAVKWLAGWATPTTRDHKDTGDLSNVPVNCLLGRQARLSNASTEGRGALAPAFSLWLMGFPPAWSIAAPHVERKGK